MNLAFTEYVRLCLATEGSGADEGVCDQLCNDALEKLRSALIAELRKRSLWRSSPSYLGVYGCTGWSPRCLDELLYDCHCFIFFERRQSLVAQLKVKENVEGLIFLSLRNFLYERQKRHDRLGFQIFTVLSIAIRRATTSGRCYVLAGSQRIRNDTVVGFALEGDPSAAARIDLDPLIAEWVDELLPELVTARGTRIERVAERLAALLAGLPAQGIQVFHFKILIDVLKHEVRNRWATLLEGAEREVSSETGDEMPDVRQAPPDVTVNQRLYFEKLVVCVEDALDRYAGPEHEQLQDLWRLLEAYWSQGQGGDKPPSKRKISRQLEISRRRLAGLLQLLQQWVVDCRTVMTGGREDSLRRNRLEETP